MSISGLKKILVVLGPTASGKSELAIHLAKKFGGEVISADSRQVYRGLDIGTAKVSGKWQKYNANATNGRRMLRIGDRKSCFVYKGVAHHLIDFVSPKRQYSPAEYASAGRKILYTLLASGYTPIICGGSGQYIDALLGAHPIPEVPPDAKLRAKLEKLSVAELFAKLKRLDPRRAKTIDRHNPRRLIRALEIVMKTGKPVPKSTASQHPYNLKFVSMSSVEVLKIGLNPPLEELRRRIHARLTKDLRRGLIAEVKKLHENGLSWKRLDELGLEYRLVGQYLRNRSYESRVKGHENGRHDSRFLTHNALLLTLECELWRYAKRQLRWFKRDTNIRWGENENTAMRIARIALRRKQPLKELPERFRISAAAEFSHCLTDQ